MVKYLPFLHGIRFFGLSSFVSMHEETISGEDFKVCFQSVPWALVCLKIPDSKLDEKGGEWVGEADSQSARLRLRSGPGLLLRDRLETHWVRLQIGAVSESYSHSDSRTGSELRIGAGSARGYSGCRVSWYPGAALLPPTRPFQFRWLELELSKVGRAVSSHLRLSGSPPVTEQRSLTPSHTRPHIDTQDKHMQLYLCTLTITLTWA